MKIDWTKWSAIAEVSSAVAIVATLLYLAVQTQYLAEQTEQNNLLMRSQARSEISSSIVETLLGLTHSDYLVDIRPESVERAGGVAALRHELYEVANLRSWENIHYQWRNGLYDDTEFEAEREYWWISVNQPLRRQIVCRSTSTLSPEFREELLGLLEAPCE